MREDIAIRVSDPSGGSGVEVTNFGGRSGAAIDYVLTVGKASACRILLPASADSSIFKLDSRISIWRTIGTYGPFQEGQAEYLVRKWEYTNSETAITAYHANSLLSRRYVLYPKTSSFSNKSSSTPADDLIKDIWDENAGTAINTTSRDGDDTGADISFYVQTESNYSAATSLVAQVGRRKVSDVVDDLTEAAAIAGGYLAAEIVAASTGMLELRTYPIARGKDRRTGASALTLSEASGTLENARLVVDHTNEKTVVIAAGGGDSDLRLVQSVADTTRRDASPLNRIEHVIQLSNITDDTELLNAARSELRKHEPSIYITGNIPKASPLIRGVDYNWGDMMFAEVRGRTFEVRLDSMRCSVGPESRSTQIVLRSLTT